MGKKVENTMEKFFKVRVDFTVTKSLYTSASSKEEAERFFKEKLDKDPYYDARTMDAVLNYKIVEVVESEKDETAEQDDLEGCSDTMRQAIQYVRDNMDGWEMDALKAEMEGCYEMHQIPNDNVMDCSRVIDLLEEYGEENDLPECWWESECEIDEILVKL